MDAKRLRYAWGNRQYRQRARTIGQLAQELTLTVDTDGARRLTLLRPLWRRVLPAEMRRSVELQGLSGGCIRIAVVDASYRFSVERVIGPALLKAARAAFPEWGLTRVKVEVAGNERGRQGT